jgi:hypothetical protein
MKKWPLIMLLLSFLLISLLAGCGGGSTGGGPTVLFSDDFQRAVGVVGNGWIDPIGNNAGNTDYFDVIDDAGAKMLRFRTGGNLRNGDPNWDDYIFSAKVKVTDTGTAVQLGARFQDQNQSCYSIGLSGGNQITLYKYVSGMPTNLQTQPVSYSANEFCTIKIVLKQSNIKVYFKDQTSAIIDVTDSDITKGRIGLSAHASANTPCYFDDVLVTSL